MITTQVINVPLCIKDINLITRLLNKEISKFDKLQEEGFKLKDKDMDELYDLEYTLGMAIEEAE